MQHSSWTWHAGELTVSQSLVQLLSSILSSNSRFFKLVLRQESGVNFYIISSLYCVSQNISVFVLYNSEESSNPFGLFSVLRVFQCGFHHIAS